MIQFWKIIFTEINNMNKNVLPFTVEYVYQMIQELDYIDCPMKYL